METSYIEKLLEGAEVEWKELGEVCNFQNGFAFKSSLFRKEGFPIIRIGNIENDNVNLADVKYFNPNDYKIGNPLNYSINKGDVLIAMSGATTGKVGYYNFNNTAYLNQRVGKFIPHESKLNNRYLYHYLLSKNKFLFELAGGGAQPNLSTNAIKNKIKIPIPPLSVQEKIVEILDSFTTLKAELKAELKAREKQYDYYREQLLSFEEGAVEWKPLGELGELVRGNGLPKSDFTEYGVPAIHYGQIYTYYGVHTSKTISFVSPETAKKLRKVDFGDVIVTNTSENMEDVCKSLVYLGTEQAVTGGHATIFKPSKEISNKFFAYFTQTFQFFKQKRKLAKGTKVIDVSARDLAKIKIPVPPIEVQEEIVAILDQFDTLVHSINEGLPKEIELRQKQYEYYRGKLLRFATTDCNHGLQPQIATTDKHG